MVKLLKFATVILEGLPHPPTSILHAANGKCRMSVFEVEDQILHKWVTNHVAEVQDHVFTGVHKKIVDLTIKGQGKLNEIIIGTNWQNSSSSPFLSKKSRPALQDFKGVLPVKKVRVRPASHVNATF